VRTVTSTVLGLLFALAAAAPARWAIDVELGAVFSGYNDVRVPNEGGTDISLSRDLETDPGFFQRLRVGYVFNERHAVSLLAAPLELDAHGSVGRPVFFEGVEFPADAPLEATYRFDSYRATYRYNLIRRDRLTFGLGFTAKVRDAAVALESDGLGAEITNTGFVPLFNFGLAWAFAEDWELLFEGDALAAPQGRAEDVLLALRYRLSENFAVKGGYRMLEGGADAAEVYNFTMLHYAVVSPVLEF
jgi:hypothetical protein